jgi:hypothetical protein
MPQETNPTSELSSTERPTLQGFIASRDDEAALLDALEKAFDYRGDVTLDLTDGSRITGYIFDRRRGRTLADSFVRLIREGADERTAVAFDAIARVEFTGRDTAAGKSFETWLKKYVEHKLAGQRASLDSEPLD